MPNRMAAKAVAVPRPRCQHAGFGTVGAPQAEVDEGTMARCEHQPRRLGSDDGLKVNQVDQAGFDQLRFGQARRDP
jgi:hypothetical protein